MKIVINEVPTFNRFKDVSVGELFIHADSGDTYMRIEKKPSQNCIQVGTAEYGLCFDDDEVRIVRSIEISV